MKSLRTFIMVASMVGLVHASVGGQEAASQAGLQTKSNIRFRVLFDANLQPEPYTGRVYVIVGLPNEGELRPRINQWHNPPSLFALDVTNVAPGDYVMLRDSCLFSPARISQLKSGPYAIQAVARRNLDHPVPGSGAGDLYSEQVEVNLDANSSTVFTLKLNQVTKKRRFNETERFKLAEIVSPSLSKFHGREIKIRAGVVLPPNWDEAGSQRYPVIYVIPGFGGSHTSVYQVARSMIPRGVDPNVLLVVPDPRCHWGHCVFADSETNGPWGKALTEELIPHVESRFRGEGSSKNRYVTGVSSGGWSALWLQISHPDLFNGCWSHCPDPVDFRDFQQINLYQPGSNMYVDDQGDRRPLARRRGEVLIHYQDFAEREELLAPGGQIRSFESVFSHRRPDGTPERLFDAKSGNVNTEVARTWERFDIRLVLERNWATLGPKLAGKLHIYAGEEDTYYLQGAVRLLKTALEKLGSDAEVMIVPDMAHKLYSKSLKPMFETIHSNFKKTASGTK